MAEVWTPEVILDDPISDALIKEMAHWKIVQVDSQGTATVMVKYE